MVQHHLTDKVRTLIINGLKTTGSFDGCLSYIEESLTIQEAQDVERFFAWLQKRKFAIGHGTIRSRWKEWMTDEMKKGKQSANAAYQIEVSKFSLLSTQLEAKAQKHGGQQQKDKNNWGYVGDLAAINERLQEAVEALEV